MDLKEQQRGVDPNVHWYYQVKKVPLFRFFRKLSANAGVRVIIDIGSGSGIFSTWILDKYPNKVDKVYQVDIAYTEEEIRATQGSVVEKTQTIPKGFENALVIMMDVLEHIEEDVATLKETVAKSKGSNNHFFITVPAFMTLWSGHDEYLGHYRRYRIQMLADRLNANGFKTSSTHYLYGMIFPLVWLYRKLKKSKEIDSDMRPFNRMLNSMLLAYNSFEIPFRKLNKFFGVTCVAEGRIESK